MRARSLFIFILKENYYMNNRRNIVVNDEEQQIMDELRAIYVDNWRYMFALFLVVVDVGADDPSALGEMVDNEKRIFIGHPNFTDPNFLQNASRLGRLGGLECHIELQTQVIRKLEGILREAHVDEERITRAKEEVIAFRLASMEEANKDFNNTLGAGQRQMR
jgi:hypothetical protein